HFPDLRSFPTRRSSDLRKKTDWRKFRLIAAALIVGSLPAVAVIYLVDGPWLSIAIGVFVLLGLGISLFPAEKFNVSPDAKAPLFIFGAAGGFMSTIAGIAGPSLTIYARITDWDYRDFVATRSEERRVGKECRCRWPRDS